MNQPTNETARPFAAGDDTRARELDAHFRSSFRVLWLIAVGIVGDASLAEDVVQEAALIAINKLDQYQPGSNFSAWASQIVRNVALNRLRSERRRRKADASLLSPVGLGQKALAEPANERSRSVLDDSEFNRRVLDALLGIGEVPRACLLLRTIEGLSYAEISRLLEIPEGTAMSHVHRTRQAIRSRLATSWPLTIRREG
jgi:RNA polymerase sigma-70 factor (ECF subfamily)